MSRQEEERSVSGLCSETGYRCWHFMGFQKPCWQRHLSDRFSTASERTSKSSFLSLDLIPFFQLAVPALTLFPFLLFHPSNTFANNALYPIPSGVPSAVSVSWLDPDWYSDYVDNAKVSSSLLSGLATKWRIIPSLKQTGKWPGLDMLNLRCLWDNKCKHVSYAFRNNALELQEEVWIRDIILRVSSIQMCWSHKSKWNWLMKIYIVKQGLKTKAWNKLLFTREKTLR